MTNEQLLGELVRFVRVINSRGDISEDLEQWIWVLSRRLEEVKARQDIIFACRCNKYRAMEFKGIVCERCGTQLRWRNPDLDDSHEASVDDEWSSGWLGWEKSIHATFTMAEKHAGRLELVV